MSVPNRGVVSAQSSSYPCSTSSDCPDPDCQYCNDDDYCETIDYCPCTPCGRCEECVWLVLFNVCVSTDSCPCTPCDDCEVCDDGECVPDDSCPCTPCDDCEFCNDGECVPDDTCPCTPCDDCEFCNDGECVPDDTCPCTPCPRCEICNDGQCVPDDTCPCTPCSDCEVCDDGRCVPDDICPCTPCDDCEFCNDGECVLDDRCPCTPCGDCEICDDGQCIDDERCPCTPCDDCEICDDGQCVVDDTCPCTPCDDCEICENGRCVEDTSCSCVPCGECEICDDGECVEDRRCPDCKECEVDEMCVDGECLSLIEAVGCPECGECEICDPDTSECIPDLTCPCISCRSNFQCVNGICQPSEPLECPPCPDCHVCDPFTGNCVAACPCYPCQSSEECYVPGADSSSSSANTFGIPPEECGYCLNKIPQPCSTSCPNKWEVCDLRTGLCVPSCKIKKDCAANEICLNELCAETHDCDRNCLSKDCTRCHPQTGWCEPHDTCSPQCKQCSSGGEECAADGYCRSLEPKTEPCPAFCGGGSCQRCDFNTNGECSTCADLGESCEETSGLCVLDDIHCDENEEKTTIDVIVFYTRRARSYVSREICGKEGPSDVHIKRYISQRVMETNNMLGFSCIKANYRVVHVHELPQDGFERIPCGPSRMCDDETDMIRGDSVDSDYSLAKTFLRPFENGFQSVFNITKDLINDYRADVVVFLYEHSSDYKGGLADGTLSDSTGKFMVPLQMRVPCEEDGDLTSRRRDAHQLFEFASQVGNLMVRVVYSANIVKNLPFCSNMEKWLLFSPKVGSPEGVIECSGGGPDPLPFHQDVCQRETRFGRLCADRMRTQIPVLSQLGSRPKVGIQFLNQ